MRFDGLRLVWLLRSCGSVLVPTEIGVNPIYITHWLWSNHGQQVVPFSVDTRTGLIEKIDFELDALPWLSYRHFFDPPD
ncbi:hypothetical protein ACSLVK_01090 [Photorhabdus tasmaniensis]|uniref:hypothetical protein n=1 Tax=Photorhabdus tasmaniensis TaxID=1004159 RepID=UPI001F6059B3|nr:hypothetical protein [Photorhabdus tasmaniensis]